MVRSLGVAPKTGPQRSGPVWFAVLAVPFRGLVPGGKSQGKQQRSIAPMSERGHENEDDESTLPLLTHNSAFQGEFGNVTE